MSRASLDVNSTNQTVSYPVKWVLDQEERSVPICMQSRNGPCALLALVNAALLIRSIELAPGTTRIREEDVMALLADYVSSMTCSKTNNLTNSSVFSNLEGSATDVEKELEAARQYAVADFLELLPTFARGVDINVRFNSCTSFEFTRELSVFDLIPNIRLVHGWIVDPQDARLAVAISRLSYNQVMNALVLTAEGCVSPDGPSAPPLEAFDFSANVTTEDVYGHIGLVNDDSNANRGSNSGDVSVAVDNSVNSNAVVESNERKDAPILENKHGDRRSSDEVDSLPVFEQDDSYDYGLGTSGIGGLGMDNVGISDLGLHGVGNLDINEDGSFNAYEGIHDEEYTTNGGDSDKGVNESSTDGAGNGGTANTSFRVDTMSTLGPTVDTDVLTSDASNGATSRDSSLLAGTGNFGDSTNTYRGDELSGMGTNNSNVGKYETGIGSSNVFSPATGASQIAPYNITAGSSTGDSQYNSNYGLYNFTTPNTETTLHNLSNVNTTTTTVPEFGSVATSSTYRTNELGSMFNSSGISPSVNNGDNLSNTISPGSSSAPARESVETANIRELRPFVVDFLESNSTQLTVYGLAELHSTLNEGETAILFRNSHFYVIRKINGEIYTLVTDVGFITELNTVWEKLTDVTGDSTFYDGAFRPLTTNGAVQFTSRIVAAIESPPPVQIPPPAPTRRTPKTRNNDIRVRKGKGRKNNCTIQ